MSDDATASEPTVRAGTGEIPRIDLKELTRTQPFELGPLIGKGGMGEVHQCRDARLERHIALKTATTKDAGELSRFVREARVQGQLEHPGIVPVYVLDWGLARHLDEARGGLKANAIEAAPVGLTTPGTLMGTPGYMAPEQVVGQQADVRSDVYSLGAVLFELLTWQMLARGRTAIELLKDTHAGCDARARERAPEMDVPPELEAVCLKATAKEAANRYASVRELHDAVDRVLAGERDEELRASMAKRHTDAAQQAAGRAAADPAHELELRKVALREVGQALALAPNHRPALETLLKLMAAPVKAVPPEIATEVASEVVTLRRSGTRAGCFAFLAIGIISPPLSRVQHAWPLVLFCGLCFVTAAFAAYNGWRKVPSERGALGMAVLAALTFMSLFMLDGPLRLLPLFAAVNTAAFSATVARRERPLIIVLGLITVLAPLVGSWCGLLPESFRFVKEGLLLIPLEEVFDEVPSMLIVIFSYSAAIVVASLVTGAVRDTVARLSERNALQAWTLRQMLPPEASAAPAKAG